MCGIFGKFFFEKTKIEPNQYWECLNILAHRGPDDQGIYSDDHIVLGNRRLSIVDRTAHGHMPMTNEDKSLWITFNGEIYNFRNLRKKLEKKHRFTSKSDSEVVLHLYEEMGPECLKELRGMYAFAIYDKRKKELFIARDRLGKKPIKYFYNNKFFIFASELKAILQDRAVPKEVDYEAIDDYLTLQYVPSPKTGFKNLYKLDPGHYISVNLKGEVLKRRYWQLDFKSKLNLTEKEWEERILFKLKEAVHLRLPDEVPFGVHLSGGIDSSLITALTAEETGKNIKTFSIGFENSEYNELPYARAISAKYQTDHQELIVKPNMTDVVPRLAYYYEEPYADPSALPTWYLSQMTRKYVSVVLNGDGGDENFAGYTRYTLFQLYQFFKHAPFKNALSGISKNLYKISHKKLFSQAAKFLLLCKEFDSSFYTRLMTYFSQDDKDLLYTDFFRTKISKRDRENYVLSQFRETDCLDWLDKLLYVDFLSYLPDDLLVKTDIASMAHSLEVRSPFLDHEFVELTAQIPYTLKIKGLNRKYLLKKIAQKYLPRQNVIRPKKGFGIPLNEWLRGGFGKHVKDKLLDNKFLSAGFFEKKDLQQLIHNHENRPGADYSNRLWTLFMLEEWFAVWF